MGTFRIGLIGCGAIGKSIISRIRQQPSAQFEIGAVFTRSRQLPEARALCAWQGQPAHRGGVGLPASTVVTDRWSEFLAADVEVVVEAASQRAVVDHAQDVLERGRDLQILSIGALADDGVRRRLAEAARSASCSVCVPCGALAGFDGLLALRRSGLVSVTYTSIKPPSAWRGTIAELRRSLDDLREPLSLFRGNAAEAALSYPQNANLAAAVALAGAGFEATQVELIADPAATANTGRLQAVGQTATLEVTLSCQSFGDNPKTSEITAASVLSSIENSLGAVKFV